MANSVLSSDSADGLIAERLNSIGVTTTFKTDATIAASDIAGIDFILISPTAVSANLRFLKTISIPCIVCRTNLYPLLDMTGPLQDVDYAVYAKGVTYPDSLRQKIVEMRDVNHPISPNIAGTQIILNDSLFMEWGMPTLKAKLVASVFGDIYKIVIFTYDIGEMMISIPAPARRVGLSFHEDVFPSLNSLGWTLFENSVYWTLRMR
jgi:hypothetical protein